MLIQSRHNMHHNIWGIIMFAQPVTVYEIITFNIFEWSRIESMTYKSRSISWATTSPNMSLDGGLMAFMMVKQWRIYLKPFSCGPKMRRSNGRMHTHTNTHTPTHTPTHTRTHTYTHTHTNTHTNTHIYTDVWIHFNECNRQEYNALHFASKQAIG